MFVGFPSSPDLVIATGFAAKIQKFRVKRPHIEPPIFLDRNLLFGLDAGGLCQDGPETPPKWPSRLDGAHVSTKTTDHSFCALFSKLACLRREAFWGSPGLYS